MLRLDEVRIGIIGLGYVGLPLAVAFARKFPVIGLDNSVTRIAELRAGRDSSLEVNPEDLTSATNLTFTEQSTELQDCNVFIVSVPTPIDGHKIPDLGPLFAASKTVGELVRVGNVVIFESTVYPGATEEECIPIIEKTSGLVLNRDFYAGYSPERVNPGDRNHRITTIKKVTSGSTPEIANFVDALYSSIVVAGTHKVSSIKIAEAAKVIENTQRDVNIALVNELSLIFERLGIDTEEVLVAAETKWNFLRFRPGLVGGHCIGVDPYYLTHKAQAIGYHPAMILAGRRINDGMGEHIAGKIVKLLLSRNLPVNGGKALIFGLAFKENCPDLRNSRVVDIVAELQSYGMLVDVYDPWVDPNAAEAEYGFRPLNRPATATYEALVLAVAHHQFSDLGIAGILAFGKPNAVVFDVKHLFPADQTDGRL